MPEATRHLIEWFLAVPPVYRWAVSVIIVGFVITLSVVPGEARHGDSFFAWLVAGTATPIQKTMHVTVYAILALAWMWTLQSIESKPLRVSVIFIMALSLGAVLEWHQTRVPGRYGTIGDVLLNLLGIVLGLLAALIIL